MISNLSGQGPADSPLWFLNFPSLWGLKVGKYARSVREMSVKTHTHRRGPRGFNGASSSPNVPIKCHLSTSWDEIYIFRLFYEHTFPADVATVAIKPWPWHKDCLIDWVDLWHSVSVWVLMWRQSCFIHPNPTPHTHKHPFLASFLFWWLHCENELRWRVWFLKQQSF